MNTCTINYSSDFLLQPSSFPSRSSIQACFLSILRRLFEQMQPPFHYSYKAHTFTIYGKENLSLTASLLNKLVCQITKKKMDSRRTIESLFVPNLQIKDSRVEVQFTPISQVDSCLIYSETTAVSQRMRLMRIFTGSLVKQLTLFSGKRVSLEEFVNNPLFKNAEENTCAFFQLYLHHHSDSFFEEYEQFLRELDKTNWFFMYESNPKLLSYLSLTAFLDDRIDEEELFVIHTVAEAFNEQLKGIQTNFQVQIRVVPSEDIASYLKEGAFPLFSPSSPEFIIINCKSFEELEEEKRAFLGRYAALSAVKKTFVEYTLKPFAQSMHVNLFSIEMSMYHLGKSNVGFKSVKNGVEGTVVLPPPKLAIDLYCASSCVDTASSSRQVFMFGFSEDDTDFYSGVRVCSIPSPLFSLPYVHGFDLGPTGLGLFAHDILYHMPLEANNPHIRLFIAIAREIKKALKELKLSDKERLACIKLASHLIDRETNEYRYLHPQQAFWPFIVRGVSEQKENFSRAGFNRWCEEMIYPLCMRSVLEDEVAMQENLTISSMAFKMMLVDVYL